MRLSADTVRAALKVALPLRAKRLGILVGHVDRHIYCESRRFTLVRPSTGEHSRGAICGMEVEACGGDRGALCDMFLRVASDACASLMPTIVAEPEGPRVKVRKVLECGHCAALVSPDADSCEHCGAHFAKCETYRSQSGKAMKAAHEALLSPAATVRRLAILEGYAKDGLIDRETMLAGVTGGALGGYR